MECQGRWNLSTKFVFVTLLVMFLLADFEPSGLESLMGFGQTVYPTKRGTAVIYTFALHTGKIAVIKLKVVKYSFWHRRCPSLLPITRLGRVNIPCRGSQKTRFSVAGDSRSESKCALGPVFPST